MEENQQQIKFYKRKIFVIPAVAVMLMAVAYAAVLYGQTNIDVTVSEALSSQNASLGISSFPGETQVRTIAIENDASVPLPTRINWTQDANPSGVAYATNMPIQLALEPGTNYVNLTFAFTNDTAIGTFNGTVSYDRIAA